MILIARKMMQKLINGAAQAPLAFVAEKKSNSPCQTATIKTL